MKIEILVDVSGSFDFKKINEQLALMKKELKDDNVEVNFLSFGVKLSKNLNELELPLSDENSKYFGGGGDNYNEYIKSSLSKKLDKLIFISDLEILPIDKEVITKHPDTNFIVIELNKNVKKDDTTYMYSATKDIIKLPNVYTVLTGQYTSLDNLKHFKEHTDEEKSITLTSLTELMLSKKNNKQIDKEMQDLLKDYTNEQIGQFAQCIVGDRKTLPNSDTLVVSKKNKVLKNKM